MGLKQRPRPIVRLAHLVCWWAVVASGAVEAHQHGRSRSSAAAAAFAVNAGATAAVRLRFGSTSRNSGALSRRPHLGAPLLQQRDTQRLLRRGRHGGQCLMGVSGLTSYVNKNLRGAVAMEDLREVSSAWVVDNFRAHAQLCGLWVKSCPGECVCFLRAESELDA